MGSNGQFYPLIVDWEKVKDLDSNKRFPFNLWDLCEHGAPKVDLEWLILKKNNNEDLLWEYLDLIDCAPKELKNHLLYKSSSGCPIPSEIKSFVNTSYHFRGWFEDLIEIYFKYLRYVDIDESNDALRNIIIYISPAGYYSDNKKSLNIFPNGLISPDVIPDILNNFNKLNREKISEYLSYYNWKNILVKNYYDWNEDYDIDSEWLISEKLKKEYKDIINNRIANQEDFENCIRSSNDLSIDDFDSMGCNDVYINSKEAFWFYLDFYHDLFKAANDLGAAVYIDVWYN